MYFHADYGEHEALIEIDTLSIRRENIRGEPWRSYSSGQPSTVRS
jgi:hypothetical protein